MDGDWTDALVRARAHSPFLSRMVERFPDLAGRLEEGRGEEALAAAKRAGEDTGDVAVDLRRERGAVSLVLAIADLAGAFPLSRVMAELSALADRSLERAIAAAIARRVPNAAPDGFIALALGKHGAGELNFSSDIDPILLYDPDRLPRRSRDEPGEAAQRYARDIVRLLSDVTEDGFVFRVDLRLRPASEVSPLAISLGAATTHYESSALAWERAAFIRARACAGDVAAGEEFLETIRPFVWRRSLDFGAIDEVRRLTARIRERQSGPGEPAPGFNVKLGRGGIREIEFFAQTHQLIHGGRDPALRHRGTRAALDALAEAQRISAEDARVLGDSYDRLRTAEHRLQMVNDRQTHDVPEGDALENVARLGGWEKGQAFLDELRTACRPVAERYDRLLAEDDGDRIKPPIKALIEKIEDRDADELAARIETWSSGRYRALKSPAAIAALDAIKPDLLAALAEAEAPEVALARWETLLERLPTAINFFRLLEARPALLALLIDCLTIAPPLADELSRRPELLDALIDNSAFDLPGTVAEIAANMRRCESDDEYEQVLDRIRVVTGETRFALGMQLVEAAQDPLAVAEALSRTAEAALLVAVEAAEKEFARRHGRFEDGGLLVLGLGRLGGGALTHTSDLDVVYLFAESEKAESDGERPLGQTLYYNRLAQRVTAALSVPTAEGALYEIDTRLRPQGEQGPLAAGLSSFARYQSEEAWTWEHMALCRARVLAGPPDKRVDLDAIIGRVLRCERDPAKLREDVLAMRSEMATHKPPRGPLDVKLMRGGLIDLEFLIHFLQLRDRTAFDPDLASALRELVDAGLLPAPLIEAHRLLTRILVGGRLLAPDLAVPGPVAAGVLAEQAGFECAGALQPAIATARQEIAAAWQDIFEETLEIDT
ncbi:bifunctional [glutamate--ammonia ligase]-adenylyl-L-tyrosine phosphorylase/[glutamate--ammonia-ligase] adenylyltransferase [Qipengyuania sp. MTN3-11]|uniref:bifunctional [glutamate--ammonia ligase]-adenylyl-L-tyrosine phosphorylase/[glutamate--ammonia-ligase] adenylyltransferase n=1 Tax=Qipengyuania sp. MTN3-11 TaxID=3056557 RepID=UPI0036F44C80